MMSPQRLLVSILFAVLMLVIYSPWPVDSSRVASKQSEQDVTKMYMDDAEMNVAMADAQISKSAFLQALAAPMPNQTGFAAKHPFATTTSKGRREHIWISQLTYDGTLLHGIVSNDPLYVSHLKIDAPVSFHPMELTDWMYFEDGKVVGGYTIRVLRKRMSAEEGAEFDRQMQFKP